MDKTTSVVAALDAGKMPTQKQINQMFDWILDNMFSGLESSDAGKLSEPGKILAEGIRDILQAYKQLGTSKNGDNKVQDVLWHLSGSNFSDTSMRQMDTSDASRDAEALRSALRTVLNVAWTSVSGEGQYLFADFASFSRLAMADFAEVIESSASHAKESLRDIDQEVQEGERDTLGRKKRSREEEERMQDPKVQFESAMDVVKDTGSAAIGTGQKVSESTKETARAATNRLEEAYRNACERAQTDEKYRESLSTLFDTASKWVNRGLDTTSDLGDTASLDDFIEDPTPEKHLHNAIREMRTLIERFAGGKSLDDLLGCMRACAIDVRSDPELKSWFTEFFSHARRSLDDPKYSGSEDARQKHQELRARWKEILSEESDKGREWKEDLGALRREMRQYYERMEHDADVQRVRMAHERLQHNVQQGILSGAQISLHALVEQSPWFWQDMFNVYAQKILNVAKDIPIPRTEYVDSEHEFVLENLNITTLNLLPGHAYIRNIADIDITAPAGSEKAVTAIGTLTHVKLQAVHLALDETSFYYKDKTATIGPSEFSGIMELTLPPQGVDVDIKFRLLPNTPQGLAARQQRARYFTLDLVSVSISEDVTVEVKKSNHAILASVFKPIIKMRFREALERTLEEQIRGVFDTLDTLAYDVSRRSEVFQDTGLGSGAALMAAIWSEIGHMRKMEGGLLTGWKATGTGVIKEAKEGEASIAMGAEPQILSGEKHGPLGTNSQPLAERLPSAKDISGSVQEGTERIAGDGKEAMKTVQSFKQSVRAKTEEERKKDGWKSESFNF
ncbi:hypothetical protein CONPUDRAFT_135878 [Coniophora puteana RWD-64-598 SS2]|uniref:Uncharacterized protein n=1 Tax=Coniophora puteana (strain RWD-64-598) TaxID=741705 RepID=A0A5M3MZ83_CONPW|nr:uncharacterized protein CONPUDRAFT_135878 [Coniophora puteana RWD-64-598 SS2]EIW84439.1 hypothetical protein CONPUDRAFT_135878 [Coniophora puteana RWD-64-598 SS2]